MSKTNKPVLIVDLDDTINDLCECWIKLYNKLYDDDLTIENITDWNIGKFTKIGDKMYDLLGTKGLFENLSIKEGCVKVLEWANKVFDVQICSATHPNSVVEKVNFLQKNLPFIPINSFNAVHNKYLLTGSVMIDDNPQNLKYFDGIKILFDRPWNKKSQRTIRVYNWEEIKVKLEKVKEGRDKFIE